ncbi:class I SAM-dependent methyltransferase [Flammeovirga kamogawensis]|uniref:Class I SAM-dependent methyltransferase n=1 Tax=Flammeovirga kamogawensis TaxID=373891 RepID=A0ABX8GRH4_9BACT|nr:class I SAM-dependent methyltransferase [Flammeovirga kamogawensis]MBB6463806.1 SAM-dependent methyltransferase [Flammeovirga kamogawensis]QWG06175.1 class I SAM-dependent methyltransferase [Flammeovirga kamogawensis]TRX68006.1 methyltransferase domain-containing protein [Flammeovirga kamogawensis]
MQKGEEWFDQWFNTPYYHILYQNRDFKEAETFVKKLSNHLNISNVDKVLDLACGKGRHAIFLNKLGFNVEGIDLSTESIQHAKQFENEKLKFSTHDMRELYKKEEFTFILNLFTSFGYFETEEEDLLALKMIANSLKHNGYFVLDYFNTYKVINSLPEKLVIKRPEMDFNVHKYLKNRHVMKEIAFSADGKDYLFTERVEALKNKDFLKLFESVNLKVINTFGDYNLNLFDREKSDRMIFVVQKQ